MYKSLLFGLFFTSLTAGANQVGVDNFVPKNNKRSFTEQASPTVLIDQAHYNFHTMEQRYKPFAKILRSDGYTVRKNTELFSAATLKEVDILVISNALNKKNVKQWSLPNYPAFNRDEVEAVYHWVKQGGSLFLIADHMPFPKAAAPLANIFGFQFNNGYVEDLKNKQQIFSLSKGNLVNHSILKGRDTAEQVNAIRTFTGQAFLSPPAAKPLLTFNSSATSLMPKRSWKFLDDTPEISVDGWHQGATLEFGKGRIVVFGEAAMFTAQKNRNNDWSMGVSAKGAEQNEQFLLNIMHWLSREI